MNHRNHYWTAENCERLLRRQRFNGLWMKWFLRGMLLLALATASFAQQSTTQSSPEPVKAGLQTGLDGRKLEPSPSGQTQFRSGGQWPESKPLVVKQHNSPWTLNAKLSVGTFAVAMTADCLSTGSLHENNGLLRSSHSSVNQGVCFGLNGTALALTILIQKKHPRVANLFRWFGTAGHVSAAGWNWRQR